MAEENILTVVTWNVKENSFMWMDQQCKGALHFEYLDAAGEVVDFHTRGESTSYLQQGTCTAGAAVTPSDFNEEENQYKGDTFGGTKPKLTKPETADGSGGTGSTGFEGVDDGTGGDDGGTDPGGGDGGTDPGGSEECDSCSVLDCPKWDDHMKQLEDIKNKIPPPPNWQEVADTFRDTIAPRIKDDLEQLLGRAPSSPGAPARPTPPALPSDLDDRGISAPTGQEAPGLDGATFDSDDIKSGAPKIPEREDPTGGFKINDPIGGLPSQEEFIENAPVEGEAPLPADPKDPDNFAPKPPEGDNIAPSPNEGENYTPPNPSEPENKAPADPTELENIAPTPGDTTGTAPLPNESGAAPIPGDTNGTAPLPNESGTAPLPGQP